MKYRFIVDLEQHLSGTFGVAGVNAPVELCPAEFTGDLTINCFVLAKQLRRGPNDIVPAVLAFVSAHADVAAAEVVKAFVNVTLKPMALFRDTVADPAAVLADTVVPAAEKRRVLVEFSAPNTNKPQHLGHVRNNTIGMTIVSILKRAGHDVVPVNLVNDRGIHICKSMIAYQRFGNGATPASAGRKGDHLVGDYYVAFDKELRRQLAELKEKQPELAEKSNEELFQQTEIGQAAQQMLVDWEKGDPAVRKLWETMNGWVFDGFAQTYKRMGVEFVRTYLESQTYMLGKDIIEDGLARGVFTRRPDGAVVIDLAKYKLDQKVVLRSDGTSVYITQDIGTTLLKQNDYKPDSMIWVVGDEQIHHFKVLFAILKELGYPWAANLYHMAYGMVNLPTGKMKSREGTVVDADNLFDELHELAKQAILERSPEAPADLEDRAEKIGLGALKFMLQRVSPKTTMMFDPQASLAFEGDTGPYVMYACARISSIVRKADPALMAKPVDWSGLGLPEERELALRIAGYGAVVRKSAADLDPSALANYLLDLSKSFSRFYSACPILAAADETQRRGRLELAVAARLVLAAGLETLTIPTVENM
jgi:arginyl-tRNA synthetase